jgi:hypothetical protein
LFETVLGGEAFGVDASLIKADANREDWIKPERWTPDAHARRATTEYLETLDDVAFGAAEMLPGWSTSRGSSRISRPRRGRLAAELPAIGASR